MTVTHRRAPVKAAPSIAAALAALPAAARCRTDAPLAWTSVPIDAIDPIALFSAARALDMEAALWLQPAIGRSIIGIGRAWAVETGGPDRFGAAPGTMSPIRTEEPSAIRTRLSETIQYRMAAGGSLPREPKLPCPSISG